ncbi:MAG: response regulator [Candidatus Omnitrophica bacterium]|nr:response regulator [Candidatus Omnitrophota bacterium]
MMARKVLIIDDDPSLTVLLKNRLRQKHYDVVVGHGPAEGFKQAVAAKPDVIILDVMMPEVSGVDLMPILKKQDGFKNVPVIILSGKDSMRDHFSPQDIFCFVQKGSDFSALMNKVEEAIALKAEEDQDKKTGAEPERIQYRENKEGQILIAAVDEYLTVKLKEFIESKKLYVYAAIDEEDIFESLHQARPGLVLLQYWEDLERLDAKKVFQEINQKFKGIPVMIFCPFSLEIDASQDFPREMLMVYKESPDLIQQLNTVIESKGL